MNVVSAKWGGGRRGESQEGGRDYKTKEEGGGGEGGGLRSREIHPKLVQYKDSYPTVFTRLPYQSKYLQLLLYCTNFSVYL